MENLSLSEFIDKGGRVIAACPCGTQRSLSLNLIAGVFPELKMSQVVDDLKKTSICYSCNSKLTNLSLKCSGPVGG